MFVTLPTLLTGISTLLAVILVMYTFGQAARLRARHGIQAPAMTGHPEFERAVRVQMNTLEQFAIFLPLLWLATIYFRLYPWVPSILGVVWVIGRILYSIGYMRDPVARHNGFLIAFIASMALLVLTVVGLIETWIVVSAS
ncbi:MAG TPA: MAPEG family protein [Rhizomicrobium sp.]|jgi:glutathione S-transferase|nr:MAPEG family protein [Rhizomicrobium sp.]